MTFWTNLYNFYFFRGTKSAYFEDSCSFFTIQHMIALFEELADIEVIIPC